MNETELKSKPCFRFKYFLKRGLNRFVWQNSYNGLGAGSRLGE